MENWLKTSSSRKSLEEHVSERLRKAYEIASRSGDLVGHVSRFQEVSIDGRSPIVVDVDPVTYYTVGGSSIHRLGDYLVAVDPKRLKMVLLKVTRIVRKDDLTGLGIEPSLAVFDSVPDPRGLLTPTRIETEPVTEMDAEKGGEPVPASSSIEPQSPVIDPDPSLLSRLLSIPQDGVVIGALATPSGPVKDYRVKVAIPYSAFLQHVLIVGTTGSGKTTLMKNMVASMYNAGGHGGSMVAVIVDMNQDFLQLPLPPGRQTLEDPVYERVFKGVRPPSSLLAVFPLPGVAVRNAIEVGGRGDVEDIIKGVASEYAREAFTPLTGHEVPREVVLFRRHGLLGARVEMGFNLIMVPYAINTMGMDSEKMATLLPGLSPLARDLLRLLRERFAREEGFYPPIQALHAAVRHYIRLQRSRGEPSLEDTIFMHAPRYIISGDSDKSRTAFETFRVEGTGISMLGMAERLLEEMERAMPHRDTVEALYRRINTLLDSEIVDIAVAMEGSGIVRMLGEPKWRDIVEASMENGAPVVLDLRWPMDKGLGSLEGPRLMVYRMLDSLVAWKTRAWLSREPTPRVVVMIDEAHQFFPQERHSREEQEANRQVASLIARIARLGRARGMGLVFSTHSPRDLHDIIVQLANTKILLRTERQHAEKLDIPPEAMKFLASLPDRAMVIVGHIVRGGYLVAKTSPPLTAHFDLSSKDISRG